MARQATPSHSYCLLERMIASEYSPDMRNRLTELIPVSGAVYKFDKYMFLTDEIEGRPELVL